MALFHVNYFSAALQKQTAMYIILPDGAQAPYRTVYQLHGLSDDYTIWLRRTSIERYADELGIMIVLLDGARSFYCDSATSNVLAEQNILESIRYIDRTFQTLDSPEGRGIGGLSMGGYGAMKLGLKYPTMFGSVAAHSGALDLAETHRMGISPELQFVCGERVAPGDDCFMLATQAGPKPQIYFDCGVDDFLLEQNRAFHAHLESLGVDHTYTEFPGSHNWAYWDAHVPAALAFHVEHMKAIAI